jgi:predicted nucleic acid-binding protein
LRGENAKFVIMIAVADTSALVALSSIERLDLLRLQFGQVFVTPAVHRELTAGRGEWRAAREAVGAVQSGVWVKISDCDFPVLAPSSRKLGKGEIEAVSLAAHLNCTCFMDEHRGRQFAKSVRVRTVGSLGIVCRAKRRGVIDAVKPLIAAMEAEGLRFGPALIRQVLLDAGE